MGDQYLAAVTEGAQTMPVLIPSLGDALEARELHRYPGPASDPDTLRECARLEGAQLWSAKVR